MELWRVTASPDGSPNSVTWIVVGDTPLDALRQATFDAQLQSITGRDNTLPALEQSVLTAIQEDVHKRGSKKYTASKQLRDRLLRLMVDVFMLGTAAGPVPQPSETESTTDA